VLHNQQYVLTIQCKVSVSINIRLVLQTIARVNIPAPIDVRSMILSPDGIGRPFRRGVNGGYAQPKLQRDVKSRKKRPSASGYKPRRNTKKSLNPRAAGELPGEGLSERNSVNLERTARQSTTSSVCPWSQDMRHMWEALSRKRRARNRLCGRDATARRLTYQDALLPASSSSAVSISGKSTSCVPCGAATGCFARRS